MGHLKTSSLYTTAVILVLLLFLITPTTAASWISPLIIDNTAGATLYVGGVGLGNFTTIQQGIDAATIGDTVFVYDESSPYYETVVIDKSIRLIGEHSTTTIIDGNQQGTTVRILPGANGVLLRGFTIRNSAYECSGIILFSDRNRITDNYITQNDWAGLEFFDCSYNSIVNNTIINNQYGVYSQSASQNSITSNHFINNSWSDISLFWSSSFMITNNEFISKGIFLFGEYLSHWNSHTIESNTIQGQPVRYYKNTYCVNVPENSGQVILANCHGGIIEGIQLSDANAALLIGFSEKLLIRNNDFTHNDYGIYVSTSSALTITHNTFIFHHNSALTLWNSSSTTIRENTILSSTYDGIQLVASHHNTVSHNIMKQNDYGLSLQHSGNIPPGAQYNELSDNLFEDNTIGLFLGDAHYNIVTQNVFTNNDCGLDASGASTNTIECNLFTDNNDGISFHQSCGNIIASNVIRKNLVSGITLTSSSHNNIIHSNAIEANKVGIKNKHLWSSSDNNIIYHNNFRKNTIHHAVDYYTNIWYNQMVGHGNYWDDYTGPDLNGDGIGDIPYTVPGAGNNQDLYPLMNPWVIGSIGTVTTTPVTYW
ncbi:MAG: right-handed parallel beta-helix repeat-containing protein [Candidatus Thermoplasmatota archaeon]|nr:right-handed parallel beta-helix repeat-containing protein [Candidatus Thermoplasmatota archaeon]